MSRFSKIGIQIAARPLPMAHGTVVLDGNLAVDHLAFDRLVGEFGWKLKTAGSLRRIAELNLEHDLVAVLFSPQNLALPWDQALRGILDTAPGALPILCHRFAENIYWPQVADAGAFHSLLVPFDVGEVRRSLGFVWDAKHRPGITLSNRPQLRSVFDGQVLKGLARPARFVA